MRELDVSPASDRPSGLASPEVRGPIRQYQATTAGTGAVAALATAGVLHLQADPAYARAVLESRAWGAEAVTDPQVQAFLTPPGGAVLAAVAVLGVAALLVWGAQRLWRWTRLAGVVVVFLGLLTAAFWSVDGGRMVDRGVPGWAVLLAVGAMAVFCAVWLLVAFRRPVRDAFDG